MRKSIKRLLGLTMASMVTVTSAFGMNSFSVSAETNNVTAINTITPQVSVSVPDGTAYYEEDSDILSVTLSLSAQTKSATYSIDNGPTKTITSDTTIGVGEGKLANLPINLKVVSTGTDGVTKNTQTFTYYKKTKTTETTKSSSSVRTSSVKAFSTVKAAATTAEAATYDVTFTPPTSWDSAGTVYAYAYYYDPDKTYTDAMPASKPLGVWPGTAMTKKSDGSYTVPVDTKGYDAYIIFANITGTVGAETQSMNTETGKLGEKYRPCTVANQLPAGVDGENVIGYKLSTSNSTTPVFKGSSMPTPAKFSKTYGITFNAPTGWSENGVYAYVYYYKAGKTYNDADPAEKPLGIWPGTEMKQQADGSYFIDVYTEGYDAYVLFVNVKGKVGEETQLLNETTGKLGEKFRPCTVAAQYPYGVDGEEVCGYKLSTATTSAPTFTGVSMPTREPVVVQPSSTPVRPATPTPIPTATPTATPVVTATPTITPTATPTATPEALKAYFGASLSAPQLNTTNQMLSAVALNASGKTTYTFAVDGIQIASGTESSILWDTKNLTVGQHLISATITDETGRSWNGEKTYTIGEEEIIPTPTIEATVTPTVEPTATPVTTVTPSGIEAEPTPTIVPTQTPDAIEIPKEEIPNAVVTPAGVIVITSKTGKTVGETVSFKYKLTQGKEVYKYTYSIVQNSKTVKTLAKKSKAKTVNWTPSKSGSYQLKVTVYNEAGTKKLTSTTKKITIKKRVINLKSMKFSSKTAKVKKNLTITTKATTTKGKVSYKLVIKNSKGKTVSTKGYSKSTKRTWKPTKKGTYKVTLYVKNGKGNLIVKTKSIKVK